MTKMKCFSRKLPLIKDSVSLSSKTALCLVCSAMVVASKRRHNLAAANRGGPHPALLPPVVDAVRKVPKLDLSSSADIGIEFMFAFLLYHDPKWNVRSHFGVCGQSCGCCRSHNAEDAGPESNCEACYTGWVLTTVSSRFKRLVQRQAATLKLCRCGCCRPDWIAAGWQCSPCR